MANDSYQDYLAGEDAVLASFFVEPFPPIPELTWPAFWLWLVGRRSRHRIEGRSMLPTLKPGDEILYNPQAYEKTSPKIGEVVIAQHPRKSGLVMIKRIVAISQDDPGSGLGDRYFLLGDNRAESTDSRSFGWVGRSYLLGKVTCHFG